MEMTFTVMMMASARTTFWRPTTISTMMILAMIMMVMMMIMVSASHRSGQERILEAYHHLHRQALGLPGLLSLVDRVRSPPMRGQDRGGGGASGGPTISRPKAVGRATASIALIVTVPLSTITVIMRLSP